MLVMHSEAWKMIMSLEDSEDVMQIQDSNGTM